MLSFIYAYIIYILHVCNQVPTSPVVYDIAGDFVTKCVILGSLGSQKHTKGILNCGLNVYCNVSVITVTIW